MPYNRCKVGLPLLRGELSSTSSTIIVPLWASSGITEYERAFFLLPPTASQHKRSRAGLHLLPPLSRKSHTGSTTAFWYASTSKLNSSLERFFNAHFLFIFFGKNLRSSLFISEADFSRYSSKPNKSS